LEVEVMGQAEIERYEHLAQLTGQIARAAAELESARPAAAQLAPREAGELDELTERLQALHLVLANEVERAWNAAEASARRARRAEIMGRLHDAVSAETTLPPEAVVELWPELGPLAPDGGSRPDHPSEPPGAV
jgi:hypothetical protein